MQGVNEMKAAHPSEIPPEQFATLKPLLDEEKNMINEATAVLNKVFMDQFSKFNQLILQQNMLNKQNENLLAQIQNNIYVQDLLEIIYDLNSNLELKALMGKIIDACIAFVEAERGAILLANEDGDLFLRHARNNRQEDIDLKLFIVPTTVLAKVQSEYKAIYIPDLLDTTALNSSQSIIDMELCSIMAAPLLKKMEVMETGEEAQRLFGIIYLDSKQTNKKKEFVESNAELLQILAVQGSVMIHNALAIEEKKKKIAEMENTIQSLRQQISACIS